jgi:hypothetical protein
MSQINKVHNIFVTGLIQNYGYLKIEKLRTSFTLTLLTYFHIHIYTIEIQTLLDWMLN